MYLRRAQELNELVSIAYEERTLDPTCMDDIGVSGDLRSWLGIRFDRGGLLGHRRLISKSPQVLLFASGLRLC